MLSICHRTCSQVSEEVEDAVSLAHSLGEGPEVVVVNRHVIESVEAHLLEVLLHEVSGDALNVQGIYSLCADNSCRSIFIAYLRSLLPSLRDSR